MLVNSNKLCIEPCSDTVGIAFTQSLNELTLNMDYFGQHKIDDTIEQEERSEDQLFSKRE